MPDMFEELVQQAIASKLAEKREQQNFLRQIQLMNYRNNLPQPMSDYELANLKRLQQNDKLVEEDRNARLGEERARTAAQVAGEQARVLGTNAFRLMQPGEAPDFQIGPMGFKMVPQGHRMGEANINPQAIPEAQRQYLADQTSPFELPAASFGAFLKDMDELSPEKQASLAGQLAATHKWIQDNVDQADPQSGQLFHNALNVVKKPSEFEAFSNRLNQYWQTDSPQAKRAAAQADLRKFSNHIDITKRANLAERMANAEREAPTIFKQMATRGIPPEQIIRGMQSGQKTADILTVWDRENAKAQKEGRPSPYPYEQYKFYSPAAQRALTEADATIAMAKEVEDYLTNTKDPKTGKALKDTNNIPFSSLPAYIQYRLGRATKDSPNISQELVLGIQAAGRIGHAVGISTQQIAYDLKKHTPDPTHDSPQLMYQKVKNIRHYIENQQLPAIDRYGNRWGMAKAGIVEGLPYQTAAELQSAQGSDAFGQMLDSLLGGKQ